MDELQRYDAEKEPVLQLRVVILSSEKDKGPTTTTKFKSIVLSGYPPATLKFLPHPGDHVVWRLGVCHPPDYTFAKTDELVAVYSGAPPDPEIWVYKLTRLSALVSDPLAEVPILRLISLKIAGPRHIVNGASCTIRLDQNSDIRDDGVTDEWRCEFYLRTKNVTPREIVSVKYPAPRCGSKTRCKNRFLTRSWRTSYRDEDAKRCVSDVNANTVHELLDGLLSGKPLRFRDGTDDPSRYDVGPDVLHPRLDIVTAGYEIELAESPTFLVLDLPGGVTVKGDGDYERTRTIRDVYRDDRAKPLFKTDNVAQTVDSSIGREDDECQTRMFTTNAIVTQVNDFDIIDAREGNRKPLASNGEKAGAHRLDAKIMFLERILAQNTLKGAEGTRERLSRENEFVYRFTLSLRGRNDKGLAVRCMHWNETEKHLLAVAYGRLLYRDYGDRPNAVALWSTRNPYAPERFYEFEESTITCLKFSAETPNHLAVGFYDGEVLIIDVSSKSLKILFQKSKLSVLETIGILDLFWTVRIENEFPRVSQYECLVTCSFNSHIIRYRYIRGSMTAKTIMRLSTVVGNDELNRQNGRRKRRRHETKNPEANSLNPSCNATEFLGLDSNTYLVGTRDGYVYTCCYDNPTKYVSKTAAHFGIIKSLDRSPYSRDVYLTTGCDCSIKIWVGNVFVEPVIILRTSKQIEKAVWSRTSSTVIVSLIENCVHVWDLDVSKDEPTSVHPETQRRAGREYCGLEFTSDGRHLCVSDAGGCVDVYAWPSSDRGGHRRLDDLLYCVAKSLYGQTYLAKTLCKERPEYADAFARLHDETRASYFS